MRAGGVADRACEHRGGGVDADDQSLVAHREREVAGEVARPAGDVEHAVARREREQQARDPVLVGHPRTEHALGDAAERGPPPALVDPRHEAGEHEVLRRAGRRQPGVPEQIEVPVADDRLGRADRGVEQRERLLERGRQALGRRGPRRHQASGARLGSGSSGSAFSPRTSPLKAISLQARDLALALDARGVIRRQVRDELADPVADLQREVRRGGAHELAHVLHRDLVVRPGALGLFALAHFSLTGTISRRESMRDCASTEMAASSPINQA